MSDRAFKAMLVVVGCLAIALACMTFVMVHQSIRESDKFRSQCAALGGHVQSRSPLCIKGDTIILRNN